MKKKIIAAVSAGVAAVSLAVAAPTANAFPAVINNTICYMDKGSSPYAPGSFKIWLHSDNVARLYRGHCTSEVTAEHNPRGFFIEWGGGCTSQWGHQYPVGQWHMFQTSNNTLKLTCS